MKQTKCVVIGAGPGGYVAAIRLAQLGVQTTIVEKTAMGGVCLNVGCIPSKSYIHAASIFENIKGASEVGITVDEPTVDLAKTRAWKDKIVNRLTTGIGLLLQKNNVEIIMGEAQFTDAHTLSITTAGGQEKLSFETAIIATGSSPMEIPPFPFSDDHVISSTEALDLNNVPDDLVVIGGGVIGLEIGMYLNKFGSTVSVVEMLDQILPGTDPEVVKTLNRVLKKRRIKAHIETRALGFEKRGSKCVVKIQKGKKESEIPADRILVCVGRRPNSADLGLNAAGVETDEQGFIPVDGQLRTNIPNIHAIGDVAGGMLLAHKASKEGHIAANVIAGQNDTFDVRAMPWAIFTDPEIAGCGLTEAAAKEQGIDVKVGRFPFKALGRAMTMRDTEGFAKIITDAATDQVLGVVVIGPEAGELIAEATLAIEMGGTAEDIALTVHAHPTLAESLMEAAESVHGRAIHILNPK